MRKKRLKDYEKGSLGTGSDALHNPFNIKPSERQYKLLLRDLFGKLHLSNVRQDQQGLWCRLISHTLQKWTSPLYSAFLRHLRTFWTPCPLRITLRINWKKYFVWKLIWYSAIINVRPFKDLATQRKSEWLGGLSLVHTLLEIFSEA